MSQCKFYEAWIGQCKADSVESTDFCEKHTGLKCSGCKEPAVKSCDHTGGLVCGCPLCANCCHVPPPIGDARSFMGMMGGHGPAEGAMEKWDAYYQWLFNKDREPAKPL